MKKRLKKLMTLVLAIVLVMTVIVTPAPAQTRFSDISGHWAEDTILSLAERGIVHGYPDGTVKPDQAITQGEYATLLTYAGEFPHGTGSASGVSWAQPFADALSAEGVLDAANDFSANEPITRLEIVSWTLRAMGAGDLAVRHSGVSKFSDTADLAAGEAGYMALSSESGLLYGYPDGTARPEAYCTRAEAFAIISRYEKVKSYVEDYQRSVIPPTVPDVHPQMMVSLAGPAEAEAYTPVTVTVLHQNVERLEWEIKGNIGATAREASSWESDLGLDGGTITFFAGGHYDLNAMAYSADGQKGSYLLSIEVREPAIRLEGPSEIPTGNDFLVEAAVRDDVHDLTWEITRGGYQLSPQEYYHEWRDTGATLSLYSEGNYTVTLNGVDGLGNSVSASLDVEAYNTVYVNIWTQSSAIVGQTTWISTGDFYAGEGATFEWQVFQNDVQLNWLDVFDHEYEYVYGGEIKFVQAGTFTIRLQITTAKGRVFSGDATATAYAPLEFSMSLPETAYTGDDVQVSVTGLDESFSTLVWKENGTTIGYDERVSIAVPLDHTGGCLSFNTPGEYTISLMAPYAGTYVTESRKITIYPVVLVGLTAPSTATVGQHVSISGTYDYNLDGLAPEWKLEKDGEEVSQAECMQGNFEDGDVVFLEPGTYLVTTYVTDALGREFSAYQTVAVLPVFSAPDLVVPQAGYTGRDINVSFSDDADNYDVQWSFSLAGSDSAEEFIQSSLGQDGGSIVCTEFGDYTITATLTDEYGRSATKSALVTVRRAPYIRMNPLDRYTDLEIMDHVSIIHIGESDTHYPKCTDTHGMTITFELLENGVPAGDDAAYFIPSNDRYTIQPKRPGDFVIQAKAEDDFGNVFIFTTKVKAAAPVYPQISASSTDIWPGDDVIVTASIINRTEEDIVWKLYMYNTEVALSDYISGELGNDGGTITFTNCGAFQLVASVTDQYGKKTTAHIDFMVMN